MKWVSVNTEFSGEGYELWSGDKKLAGISYSNRTHIARVMSNLGKRLFFFEKKGFLAPRTIITNEYGIKMGMVEEDRLRSNKGHLELDGKKYYYVFNENNSGDLKVYDEEMKHNLLTCSFNTITKGFAKTRSLLDTKFPSLLLVLCWYAFLPHSTMASEAAIN